MNFAPTVFLFALSLKGCLRKFILQTTFATFSHGLLGFVGSNAKIVIIKDFMNKKIRRNGRDTIHILTKDTICSCAGI